MCAQGWLDAVCWPVWNRFRLAGASALGVVPEHAQRPGLSAETHWGRGTKEAA